MKCEFSEFTYGFNLGCELVISQRNIGHFITPILPSLIDEANWGFDFFVSEYLFEASHRIGRLLTNSSLIAPLALQFKIPEYISPSHVNRRLKERGEPSFESPKLFKIKINQSQNQTLLEKAAPYNPFYAAPLFVTSQELVDFSQKQLIEARSRYIQPQPLQGNIHHTYYNEDTAYTCSSPIKSDLFTKTI